MTATQKIAKVFAMKKKASRLLIVISAILLLVAALCALYFFGFQRFVLVSDPAYSYLLPTSSLLRLRLNLALSGRRLVVVSTTSTDLSSASSFTPILLNLSTGFGGSLSEVLLGPLASQCAVTYDVDVSSLLSNCVVYGMWNEQCSLFDATIISDVNAGWTEATSAVASAGTMAQNVGVAYDSLGTSALQAIKSQISENSIVLYSYDSESRFYFSNTISDMNEKQVVLALCPHLNGFEEFFTKGVSSNDSDSGSSASSVSWIVDYRYAKIVPKKQLYGIVVPDLSGLAKTLISNPAAKQSGAVYTLEYKYEAR